MSVVVSVVRAVAMNSVNVRVKTGTDSPRRTAARVLKELHALAEYRLGALQFGPSAARSSASVTNTSNASFIHLE